jgi:hypothetical protein
MRSGLQIDFNSRKLSTAYPPQQGCSIGTFITTVRGTRTV